MKKVFLLCTLALSVHSLSAQKKTVDESAYQTWKRINNKSLSYNGKWMSYSTVFQDEEKENKKQIIIQEAPKGKRLVLENISDLKFIGKKDWIQYSVNDSTILQNLKTGVKKLWKSKHYTNALEGTDFLYYTRPESPKGEFFLQRLVCYNLESNDSVFVNNIKSSRFLKNKSIVYVQVEKDKVLLKQGIPGGKQQTIYSAKASEFGDFQLNGNESGGTFTLKTNSNADFNMVYYFNLNTNSVTPLFNYDDVVLNDPAYSISKTAFGVGENANYIQLQLFGNTRPENTQIPKSGVEIWRSNQGAMERRQELLRSSKTLPSEQKYLYDIKNKKVIKLASKGEFDQVAIPESGNFKGAFGLDKKPYAVEVDWTFNERNDIYWIDAATGKSTKVLTGVFGSPSWNPQGSFAVMYDEKQKVWTIFDPISMQFKNICSQIPYPVSDDNVDMKSANTAFGIAGWLNNGNTVVIYDQFDLWAIDLTNQNKAYSITQGYGRKNKVELRYGEEGFIGDLDQRKSISLIGFDTEHKSKGIYKLINNSSVAKIFANPDYNVRVDAVSADNSSILFSKESYTIFPDLWWGTAAFGSQQKITDVNPQQKEYAWGTSKLLTWKSFNGKENQGNLYLPDNYDSKKTYPVIVHFYEKHTEEFNAFQLPEVSTSNINIPTYVSRGYIVFQPDVHYTYGDPGNSVYNDVVSGVEYLISKGITEKGKIGIQGHSFGGYETSFLTTKTDLFSCAIVGSGVSNFTSNYPVMRSNGISTMFKYEADQYRMGSSLYDNLDGYIKNSPLFSVKNIKTPILIFHNDNDRAVPYQEGQSLFFALRRLGKPALLVNYKKEGHTLEDAANKKDWTLKMQQYFDYYLKGENRPDWM
ncbi:dipeptidyl aminopeptidase/acylaminoacyl peptidase [Flavobacterium sp. HSC-32F16]|uniref:alpha/beta hydrolase family protein n=1 Tax=Flavobacterium sp. HSC-32F16 TaxID=2910964 RepID=UPI0020A3B864|nr:prolyl oligopeptidase family serine peptidase [Flavobacterium sp. HSC-32F16]MCP2029686.1 dipeptidyl aminopeptidase/acylaminoacyl peptidase [Flavobacterium sp. HSC-32F16]